ncbi:MAG: DsrE family protein [Chromatiales bacterium]|nr:DsrE family protein [Chromatiales bacterium]
MVNEGPVPRTRRATRPTSSAKAALAKGHEIQRVFFYHDGVNNATRLTEPPQDDRHIVNRWSKLDGGARASTSWSASPRRCAAASRTRMLAPGFRISGLGPAGRQPASRPTAW